MINFLGIVWYYVFDDDGNWWLIWVFVLFFELDDGCFFVIW